MQFMIDTEFHEDGERINPISIALVAPTGEWFYRVYADWLCDWSALQPIRRHGFLMREVIPRLPDLAQDIVRGLKRVEGPADMAFATNPLIVPGWRVAHELEQFVRRFGAHRREHELWAYYGAYDHVVMAQTFGTMMQLPECVPMFTRELMQLEADVNARRARCGLGSVERPAKGGEHNALADATWNLLFKQALEAGDAEAEAARLAWTIEEGLDLVTIPSRVFVAGHERLTAQGPDEGYTDKKDELMADRLWNALL